MKRIELFREFQKNVMNAVQTEAVMCNISQYAVKVAKQRTEVAVYIRNYSATMTFYISGRVVIKTFDQNSAAETVISDKTDLDYYCGKCTVADLISRYVYEVFNVGMLLRNRWREDYRQRRSMKSVENESYLFDDEICPGTVEED